MSLEPEKGVPTLYHGQWMCSSIPLQIVRELSIPSDKLAVREILGDTMQKLRTDPVLLRISPRRVLPVLVMPDGSVIVEAVAISLWLLETFDVSGKLHPRPGDPTRAKFLQGMVYAAAEGYKATMSIFMLCFMTAKNDRDKAKISEAKEKHWQRVVVEHLRQELQDGRDYYTGSEFTAVDIAFGYLLVCAETCDEDLISEDFLKAYNARLKKREAYKKLYTP